MCLVPFHHWGVFGWSSIFSILKIHVLVIKRQKNVEIVVLRLRCV